MGACAMQTFNNVTQAVWQSFKQAVETKFGIQITSDSGNIRMTLKMGWQKTRHGGSNA
jgi:hypothetical protein